MTLPLTFRPEIELDLAEARDWYEKQENGIGDAFLAAVYEVFDRIRETPLLYAPEYKTVRRVGLNKFPYVVYYRILANSIEVIAVMHGNRSNRHWRSRT